MEHQILLLIKDDRLRDRIGRALREAGFRIEVISSPAELFRRTPLQEVVILHTNDDVAALTQIVYELYFTSGMEEPLPIIGMLSRDAGRRNPSVSMWCIGGHAAVSAIVPTDGHHTAPDTVELVRRLIRGCDLDESS